MITIGAIYSGPELEGGRFDRILSSAMRAAEVATASFEFGSRPAVNVVFCVPGSLGHPDWQDLRVVRYSKRRKLLLIQAAVPEKVISGPAVLEYVVEALLGANALAFESYRQKGLDYPLPEANKLAREIGERAKTIMAERQRA